MTPIHKDESRHDAKNYRPITITSQLCRILEKIIKDSLIDHIEKNTVITDRQHGFTSKRSCLTNLLVNLEDITSKLDNWHAVDQIYLDLQKAFDKVPHRRLLYKLQKYGISSKLLCWIESFLSQRTQRVKVNGAFSKWTNVSSGVPQGSVLGPILFILYINDLPDNLKHCTCDIFADDTKIHATANDLYEAANIQSDLDSLSNWCKEWMLSFNKKKCHLLHFGRKNVKCLYHLDGFLISPVDYEKDLGVTISHDLKAEKNIDACVKKANKVLGMIRRTFSYLDEEILAKLYKVFVRPHLEYCQQVWAPYLQKDKDTLEGVQRRATKLVKSLEELSYEERLKRTKLYSLEQRRIRGDMILTYRIMTGDIKIKPCDMFSLDHSTRTRGHNMRIAPKLSNGQVRQSFFSQRVGTIWNKLPVNIVNSVSVAQFKEQYDKWAGLVV